jgi:hypothetical protein
MYGYKYKNILSCSYCYFIGFDFEFAIWLQNYRNQRCTEYWRATEYGNRLRHERRRHSGRKKENVKLKKRSVKIVDL